MNRPLYCRCMQGRYRAGAMVFAYRVRLEKWSYEHAYKELLDHNFHPLLSVYQLFLLKVAQSV